MEATHNIKYEGLELEVWGEFEQDEPETGYKGGWSYFTISTEDGVDISWMLKEDIINKINEIIVTENY
jgi:hypothetical protein